MSDPKACQCPTRKGLEELFRLLQHLETTATPTYVLTLNHADLIRGMLHAPCPCEGMREQLESAMRVADQLMAERDQLRAELEQLKSL